MRVIEDEKRRNITNLYFSLIGETGEVVVLMPGGYLLF